LQQFERAVEADPEFALAYVALSTTHFDLYWYGIDHSDERRQKALAAAQRARELQPDLPEARLAMAAYFYDGYEDCGAALQELDAVRDRLPLNVDLYRYYAAIYRRMGRWDESVDSALRAIVLDPFHIETMWSQSAAMRRFDEARDLIKRAISMAPDMDNLHEMLAYIERWDSGNTQVGFELAHLAPRSNERSADQFHWWHERF
jgi:tetratricopeptide (TPR) repeat protein